MGHMRELTILTSKGSSDLRILRARERRGRALTEAPSTGRRSAKGALRSPEAARTSVRAAPELPERVAKGSCSTPSGGEARPAARRQLNRGSSRLDVTQEIFRGLKGRQKAGGSFTSGSTTCRRPSAWPFGEGRLIERQGRRARGSSANRGGWLKTLEAG